MRRLKRGSLQRHASSIALISASVLLGACSGSDGDDTSAQAALEVKTLSNRADLISGNDALLEVVLPAGVMAGDLKVDVGGRDISSSFATREGGRVTGFITGLASGDNIVTASAKGARGARLTITNHPASGPIISGEQATPLYCATPVPQSVNGDTPATNASGLSGQPDVNCMIASEFKLYYRTTVTDCSAVLPDPIPTVTPTSTNPTPNAIALTNSCFKPYTVGTTPSDMAQTTTDAGVTVPYIVRVERGTRNRGIYDLVSLFDPAKPWTAIAPQSQWNKKVYMYFGVSTGQPKRQSRPATAWTDSNATDALARGFLVVTSNLMDGSRNSNRVVTAETAMMLMEHIGDTYGLISKTIGYGSSGGSISQAMINTIFPGLLDGTITSSAFGDQETTILAASDCVLLNEAFQKPEWLNLMVGKSQDEINQKKSAISGLKDFSSCHSMMNLGTNSRTSNPGLYFTRTVSNNLTGAISQSPTVTNNCELPNSAVYDPANPAATRHLARCDMWSLSKAIVGTDPATGHGKNTRDNVGVQYGLKALQSGAITAEEFVTLNDIVGGFNRDMTLQSGRTVADEEALKIAYRTGLISSGKNLAKLPIIDLRGWNDSTVDYPPGAPATGYAFHFVYYSFSVQDRLKRDVGSSASRAMWRYARTNLAVPANMDAEALTSIDQWTSAIQADRTQRSAEEKVRAGRPASAADYCLLPQDPTQTNKIFDQSVCDADPYLKPTLSPRQIAGAPRTEDVLKCQLKPISAAEYAPAALTPAQLTRLQATFGSGVCDWSKLGVGQQDPAGPLTFKDGPGGQPIGPAPVSRPL